MADKNTGRDEKGKWLPGYAPNPKGKGGFAERPQDISRTWSKETAPAYLRQKYIRCTLQELQEEMKKPDLTAAQIMVLKEVMTAIGAGEVDLKTSREAANDVFDRVDGKATAYVEQTTKSVDPPVFVVDFVDGRKKHDKKQA